MHAYNREYNQPCNASQAPGDVPPSHRFPHLRPDCILAPVLTPLSPRWHQITPARFIHEATGYALISDALADRDPHRVWANFDFEGPDGAFHHVDALVLTGVGLFALQFVDATGAIEGDAQTWRVTPPDGRAYVRANPAGAATAAAAALAVSLEAMRPDRGQTPVVGLAVVVDEVALSVNPDGRRGVVGPAGEVNLATALRDARFPGAKSERLFAPSADTAEALAGAIREGLEARLVHRADHYRRAGDWRLGELLFTGPTFQDFRAQHVSDARKTCRVRRFNVAERADEMKKVKVERAARREYALLASLEHPGVAQVRDFRATEFGPCLFFDDAPGAERLDAFLAARGGSLSFEQRVDLFEQLAEAVRYVHRKGIVHRTLSPHCVLVRDHTADRPHLQVFSWQTGDRAEGTTSRGTQHVQQLIEAPAQAFIAPEVACGLEADVAADVFSLGVMACALFAGRAPASFAELHEHVRFHGGLRISAFGNAMPQVLEEVIFDATRGEVGERIATVEILAERMAAAYARLQGNGGSRRGDDTPAEPETVSGDPTRVRPGMRFGAYEVERTLGAGASAVALLVKDPDGRQVVLKVPRSSDETARIREEAATLGRFDHPNIVRCHGVVEVIDRPVLVVDYAGKDTLRDRLRQEVLAEELLQNLGDDLLSALEHIIDRGELHRDLKPANLALRTMGKPEKLRLLVFDFSLAGLSRAQLQVGTAPYRDPFLGQGMRRVWDAAAEMYAAALILHEMATGSLPTWGDGRSAPDVVADLHPRIEPERFDPGLREGLADFFRRSLHREASERFPTVESMRAAWRAVFDASATSHTEHPSQAPVNVDTPVGHLGLSTRALNALDRMGLPTVAELLRVAESTLRFQPGLGALTRNELLEMRAKLGHLRSEAERVNRPAPAVEPPVKLLEHFIDFLQRGRGDAATAARVRYLGLEPLTPTQRPGDWPSASEVAEAMGVTRTNVSAHLVKDRERWRLAEPVVRLRDDLLSLLEAAGGVATPRQLGEELLRVWFTDVEGESPRLRLACAVARLGVEAEMAEPTPRYGMHREATGRVLVATDEPRVAWARDLGRIADGLAARDPLPHPGQVAEALRAVARDDALSTTRLLRLAAGFSHTAAISTWQELYPRGMAPERALSLARNAILTLGPRNQIAPVTPQALRERVVARYPEAAPLPDRPALDAVVQAAGLPLVWSEAEGAYAPEASRTGLLTGTHSTRQGSTRYSSSVASAATPRGPDGAGLRGAPARRERAGSLVCLRGPDPEPAGGRGGPASAARRRTR